MKTPEEWFEYVDANWAGVPSDAQVASWVHAIQADALESAALLAEPFDEPGEIDVAGSIRALKPGGT